MAWIGILERGDVNHVGVVIITYHVTKQLTHIIGLAQNIALIVVEECCREEVKKMAKEYTERYKGFQIRDVIYLGEPPKDIPPTFDVVKWKEYDHPIMTIDLCTGKQKESTEYCYTVGRLIYDAKEPCFDFESVGLRWLKAHPDEDVEKWIIKWCEYKLQELDDDN